MQTLAEQLSYVNSPRPFKNPNYTKNVNRRAKNLKAVLGSERERERTEREKRRQEREEKMDVDGENAEEQTEEDLPTCELCHHDSRHTPMPYACSQMQPSKLPRLFYRSGSTVILPGLRYVAICLLKLMNLHRAQGPYTDPATGLRYHDKSIYELIKGLVSGSFAHW